MQTVVGYLSGPVDARDVYDRWLRREPTDYFGTSYMQQFFSVVADLGATGHVITTHSGARYDVQRGDFLISNRPRILDSSGWRYHLREIGRLLSALKAMQTNGSRVIVLTDAQNYWALTLWLRFRGVKFINALHCAIRPAFSAASRHSRFLIWITGRLHYSFGDATLSASPLIDRQLQLMPGKRKRRVSSFLPTYRPQDFAQVVPAKRLSPIKSVLYAGRIVRNKGVFDLLETAGILETRHGPGVIVFDVCGEGSDLHALQLEIIARGMSHCFRVYGFCDRTNLIGRFAAADIVIVPTRTDFEEGFAMIVAEGVIAGRPVVTSRVCPALEVVREACLEVEPDDPLAYADAISLLIYDPDLYNTKRRAAADLRNQFFDVANSYGAKLKPILQKLLLKD